MSNEIATYSMILSKLSLGQSGTECPTKTQILAINSLIVIDNASTYGANECVKIDDIRKKVETWNYYLTVSPTSMSFGAGGGSKSFTVSSYKRKVLDGVEQSGDTSVSLKSTVISGSGFSLSGTTVSASANEITSNRTGTVTITQNESNKTATISLSQSGDDVSSYGEWVITVSANPTSVSSSGGTSTITASAKRTIYWESGNVTEETGNPTLSTNLGSLSSTSSPSTLTLGENTSTSSRTATITATHGGKSATCTVTQSGATPSTTYTFFINPYNVNVGSSGGSGSVTITSYKTVGSSTYDVDYSIDSSTLPSWASFNKSTSTFTIQSTTSTTGRTAKVYFDQDESGKRDYAELTQTGYTPPADTYVFTWHDGSTSSKSESFQATGAVSSAITLVSTKNGSNHPWSTTSHPSWITIVSETATSVTIQASNNTGSARSGSVVLTQEDSGKTLTINVSQEAKATDEYYLGVRKSGETSSYESITFNNVPAKTTNWSGDYTYVSRKNGEYFNNVSFSTNVSWITVNSSGSYTVAHNTSGLPRSGTITLTQAESGLKCYIYIYQQEYSPTYGMRITPSSIKVSSSAQNVNFSVDSYKTVLHSDGSETEESVDYTFSTDSKWFTYYGTTTNTTCIVITSNITTSQRSATFTLTQVGGKSGGIVTVTQAAGQGGEVTDTFTVTPSSQKVRGNSATAVVNSSLPWTAHIGQGTIYSTVSPTSGSAGQTTITISDTTSLYQVVQATITRTFPSYKEITATVTFVR